MPNWYAEKRASGLFVAKPRARVGFSKAAREETVSLAIQQPDTDGEDAYAVAGNYVEQKDGYVDHLYHGEDDA